MGPALLLLNRIEDECHAVSQLTCQVRMTKMVSITAFYFERIYELPSLCLQ